METNDKINFSPYVVIVLQEMCSRVNADYYSTNFKEEQWFWKYEWTEEEQNSFKDWLINLLKTNKQARKEIMRFPSLKKYEETANFFIMNYGWKTIKK